jgi:hypothetical protein
MLRSLNGDYDKNTKGGRTQYKSPFWKFRVKKF